MLPILLFSRLIKSICKFSSLLASSSWNDVRLLSDRSNVVNGLLLSLNKNSMMNWRQTSSWFYIREVSGLNAVFLLNVEKS